eukprot:7338423-Pyramimonas_sp.AAC.1
MIFCLTAAVDHTVSSRRTNSHGICSKLPGHALEVDQVVCLSFEYILRPSRWKHKKAHPALLFENFVCFQRALTTTLSNILAML